MASLAATAIAAAPKTQMSPVDEGAATLRLLTIESENRRYVYHPIASVAQYPCMYGSVDIGIVPNRVGTPFQESRSDVKGWEMVAMGVPCIASPLSEYRKWRGDGTGCIIVEGNNREYWRDALRMLIENEQLRKRLAREAYRFARTRSIDKWTSRWLYAYTQVIDDIGAQTA
jgi:glycosyltransferase involved in cell wall biosynthesis